MGKMVKVAAGLVTLCAAVASTGAAAQMKEMPGGTWELRHKMEIPDMPPEMAARMGARVMTVCVKPGERQWHEQRNPNDKGERKCEQTDLKVDGDRISWKMKCADGTTGEGELVHNGKDSYTHTMSMKGPRGSVKTVTEGKRISDTCESK